MVTYPRFLRELLDSCPGAGHGVHHWLFRTARYLHRYHAPAEIAAILEQCSAHCGRELEPHEIPDAIRNSGPCSWEPDKQCTVTYARRRRVPLFEPELATKTANRVPFDITPEWLKLRSPQPVNCSADEFLSAIFEPAEKTLIFNSYRSQGYLWPDKALDEFARTYWPDGTWFLCNPVDGLSHINQRLQRYSRRSMEAVTSWRYAVLECDHEPKETWLPVWLKILVQLPLPIVAVTDSAGRSVHALVRVDAASKEAWDNYKCSMLRRVVQLGADDGALSAVRLTRLPNTYRGDRCQELLYLNPAAQGAPILEGSHLYL
jgi:hypothetical protein